MEFLYKQIEFGNTIILSFGNFFITLYYHFVLCWIETHSCLIFWGRIIRNDHFVSVRMEWGALAYLRVCIKTKEKILRTINE